MGIADISSCNVIYIEKVCTSIRIKIKSMTQCYCTIYKKYMMNIISMIWILIFYNGYIDNEYKKPGLKWGMLLCMQYKQNTLY